MNDALRRVMLKRDGVGDLAADPSAADRLAAGRSAIDALPIGRGRAEHPVCGDELVVTLRVGAPADGVAPQVVDFAWQASGCPALLAVAASTRAALVGAPVADRAARIRERLAALGDLAVHERHAEKMMLRALDAAFADLPR